MKFYLNTLFIIFLSSFMISCSTINDRDVSKIIDKTENWLFNDEENLDEEKAGQNEFNEEEFTEESIEIEEVFPDINDVPQTKPEFEQIDESFFEGPIKLSKTHSNFFENEPNISANSISSFISKIQKRVEEKHNILLEKELRIID